MAGAKEETKHFILSVFNSQRYTCDQNGNVFGWISSRGKMRDVPILLKPQICKRGYYRYSISSDAISKPILGHLLIYLYFNKEIGHKMEINHKNGIKTDNRLDNLEVVTASQNTRHSFDVLGKTIPTGIDHPRSSLGKNEIEKILIMKSSGMSGRSIAKTIGVSGTTVNRFIAGKTYENILRNI